MTRKRFVKLLMSYGIQRNTAQIFADVVNSRNIPYAKAIHSPYIATYKISYRCRKALKVFSQRIITVTDAWQRLGFALKEVGVVSEEPQ